MELVIAKSINVLLSLYLYCKHVAIVRPSLHFVTILKVICERQP